MILGLDDIPGGSTFVSFLVWLVMTGMFYLVGYMAVLNVLDDLTRNSLLKIPAMLVAAAVFAGLMSILHYKPLILFILMGISNFHRVNGLEKSSLKGLKGIKINKPLFFAASYSYITLTTALAYYFQMGPLEGL